MNKRVLRTLSRGTNESQKLEESPRFKFRAPNCKFSKADRFAPRRFSVGGEFRALPSTIGTGRTTSFGFGKRLVLQNSSGADAPPCNSYNIPSCFDRITGGVESPIKGVRRCSIGGTEVSPVFTEQSREFRIMHSMDESPCRKNQRHFTPGPRRISIS